MTGDGRTVLLADPAVRADFFAAQDRSPCPTRRAAATGTYSLPTRQSLPRTASGPGRTRTGIAVSDGTYGA